ncbi:hypothetical protein FQZ97_966580 [compost metagenome]
MKPHTPAPRKATTEQPTAHSSAAWLGCSRRRRCTMLKANTVIMKKGIGSMAEKIEPTHSQ